MHLKLQITTLWSLWIQGSNLSKYTNTSDHACFNHPFKWVIIETSVIHIAFNKHKDRNSIIINSPNGQNQWGGCKLHQARSREEKIAYECREIVAMLFAWLCLIAIFDKGSENMIQISIILAPKAWKLAWGKNQNSLTHKTHLVYQPWSGTHTQKNTLTCFHYLQTHKHTHNHYIPVSPVGGEIWYDGG